MEIEKTLNHSHFFSQDSTVYEMLTTGKTRMIRRLDFFYANCNVLSNQKIILLNTDQVHGPKYEPQQQETPQLDLFS